MASVIQIAKNAKTAAICALQLSEQIKNEALLKVADLLEENKQKVVDANNLDLSLAKLELEKVKCLYLCTTD